MSLGGKGHWAPVLGQSSFPVLLAVFLAVCRSDALTLLLLLLLLPSFLRSTLLLRIIVIVTNALLFFCLAATGALSCGGAVALTGMWKAMDSLTTKTK